MSRNAEDLDMFAVDCEIAVCDRADDARFRHRPVSILLGQHDQAVAIANIRSFRDGCPKRISLIELEDAGLMQPYAHRDMFLSAVWGNRSPP